MPLPYRIPARSEFIPTGNVFTADFNNPTIGKYDFNNATNTNQFIIDLEIGSLYLLDRMSVSGTISEALFTDSINVNPTLTLKKAITKERLHPKPIPIINYVDNQDLIIWAHSDKANESLVADFRGLLDQIPATVGVTSIDITISFSIYKITQPSYITAWKGDVSNLMGDQIRGASGFA